MKKIVGLFLIVVMSLMSMGFVSVREEFVSESLLTESYEIEERILCTATLDNDFVDNTIMVVLNKRATQELRPVRFNEIRHQQVEDLTESVIETMRNDRLASRNSHAENENDGDFRRIKRITLDQHCRINVLRAVRILERHPDVLAVEPEFIFETVDSALEVANFQPFGLGGGDMWAANQIQLPQTHAITRGLSTITVGILDGGVDAAHPYLANRINRTLSADFTNDPFSGDRGLVDHHWRGHGTNVAGVLVAQGATMTGVAPNIQIASLRVSVPSNQVTIGNIVRAIAHADAHRIPILIMSMSFQQHYESVALENAIRSFTGLFVNSAGNSGGGIIEGNRDITPFFPPSYVMPNLISVGASIRNDNMQHQSGFGQRTIELFAPGVDIRTTYPGGHFVNNFGNTSAAAPFVAGTAALMLSVNQNLTPFAMRQIIMRSVDRVASLQDRSISGGRLNAFSAVRMAQTWNPTVITTAQQFSNIRTNPNGNFVLGNGVDLSSLPSAWTPIPNFTGTLDGNRNHVRGLNIDRNGQNLDNELNLGIFANLDGAVTNLIISNSTIFVGSNHNGNGWIHAGLLAGRLGVSGEISRIETAFAAQVNLVEVHRDRSAIGGLVGVSNGLVHNNTLRSLRLIGNGDIGGAIGSMNSGIVSHNSLATSSYIRYYRASNNRSIGGVIGNMNGGNVRRNSVTGGLTINRANSSGSPNVGAIVGRRQGGTVSDNSVSNVTFMTWTGLFNRRDTQVLTTHIGRDN